MKNELTVLFYIKAAALSTAVGGVFLYFCGKIRKLTAQGQLRLMLLMSSTAAEAAFNLNKFESRLRINYRAGIFAVNGGNKRFCGVHFEKHHRNAEFAKKSGICEYTF